MSAPESSSSHRDYKKELTQKFTQTNVDNLLPHQLYPVILLFLAHGCSATVLLDFFYFHPNYQSLKRFMLRYPSRAVQAEIEQYEVQRLVQFEKILALRELYIRYGQPGGNTLDQNN